MQLPHPADDVPSGTNARGAGSFEEWWTRTSALAGPLANMLTLLSEEATHALHARLREDVRAYETPTGLEVPGVNLVASGHRP